MGSTVRNGSTSRLRDYRISWAKTALEASGCGAFLLFDFYNIRDTTQTWIGGALGDMMIRYRLLTRDREPILWTSALRCGITSCLAVATAGELAAGFLGFRGAVALTRGLMRDAVTEIKAS